MKLKSQIIKDVLIIEIEGEIMGGAEAEEFKNIIFTAIEDDVLNIVVNLKNASWMNSSGLGMLITGLTTVRSSGGDLRLAHVSERLLRPLKITKVDSVFEIYDSVTEAIDSY